MGLDLGTINDSKFAPDQLSPGKRSFRDKMAVLCSFFSFLLVVASLVVGTTRSQSLIFDEEFETLNLSRWQHEITLGGGGNWEFELYSNNRTNSYVKDGVLYIHPTFLADDIGEANVKSGYRMDVWGSVPGDYCTSNQFYGCTRTSGDGGNYLNPIKSAKLRTVQSFSFKYGRVEIRAKLPRGDWLWPAFWLLPRENQYGDWPASGEIDIMESRGNPPSYQPGGYDTFGSTLHWGPAWNEDMWSKTHAVKKGVDLTADFHTYGLVWNASYIGTYLDSPDNKVLDFKIAESFWTLGGWPSPPWTNPWENGENSAPFDREFFLIINLAAGGTNGYFPDGFGKPWSDSDPHAVNAFWDANAQWSSTWTQPLAVESVKVWNDTTAGARSATRAFGNEV